MTLFKLQTCQQICKGRVQLYNQHDSDWWDCSSYHSL